MPYKDIVKRQAYQKEYDSRRVGTLLCHNCNVGLGTFGDSPELMQEAIAYLEKYRG